MARRQEQAEQGGAGGRAGSEEAGRPAGGPEQACRMSVVPGGGGIGETKWRR
jgi:hypothetical protein